MNNIVIKKLKNLTRSQAEALLGQMSDKGKIIGVTPRPGLGYPDGLYLTITKTGATSRHFRVGKGGFDGSSR